MLFQFHLALLFISSDIIASGWKEKGSFFKNDRIRSKLITHCGSFLIYHYEAGKEFLE
jgi:urease accessory protein UreH